MSAWWKIAQATSIALILTACSHGQTVPLNIDVTDAIDRHLPLAIEKDGTFKLRVSPWYGGPQFLVTSDSPLNTIEIVRFSDKLFPDYPKKTIGLHMQTISLTQCSGIQEPLSRLAAAYMEPLPDRIPVEVDGDEVDLSGKFQGLMIERQATTSVDPAFLAWIPVFDALNLCGIDLPYRRGGF